MVPVMNTLAVRARAGRVDPDTEAVALALIQLLALSLEVCYILVRAFHGETPRQVAPSCRSLLHNLQDAGSQ